MKIIILAVVLLLLGGGGFFALDKLTSDEDASSGAEAEAAEETSEEKQSKLSTETLALGEFLVNIHSNDGKLRYLQTEISVVVTAPEEEEDSDGGHGAGEEEEEPSLPPASHRYARDVAIEVLSSQNFERLRGEPDRSKLKATLQQKLDQALKNHEVRDILFTAFVMQ